MALVRGTELDIGTFVVVLSREAEECGVVLDTAVVGHGLDCVSTLQDTLQYAL